MKRLRLSVFSTPLSSRGIVTIRSRSTWVVDLACELAYQSSGEWSDKRFGVKRLGSSICEILIRRGPSDQGRHTTIGSRRRLDFGVGRFTRRVYKGWCSNSRIHESRKVLAPRLGCGHSWRGGLHHKPIQNFTFRLLPRAMA
jgi:hypothetical protein